MRCRYSYELQGMETSILEIRGEIDEVLNNRFANDFRMFSQERSESIIHNKPHINHYIVILYSKTSKFGTQIVRNTR